MNINTSNFTDWGRVINYGEPGSPMIDRDRPELAERLRLAYSGDTSVDLKAASDEAAVYFASFDAEMERKVPPTDYFSDIVKECYLGDGEAQLHADVGAVLVRLADRYDKLWNSITSNFYNCFTDDEVAGRVDRLNEQFSEAIDMFAKKVGGSTTFTYDAAGGGLRGFIQPPDTSEWAALSKDEFSQVTDALNDIVYNDTRAYGELVKRYVSNGNHIGGDTSKLFDYLNASGKSAGARFSFDEIRALATVGDGLRNGLIVMRYYDDKSDKAAAERFGAALKKIHSSKGDYGNTDLIKTVQSLMDRQINREAIREEAFIKYLPAGCQEARFYNIMKKIYVIDEGKGLPSQNATRKSKFDLSKEMKLSRLTAPGNNGDDGTVKEQLLAFVAEMTDLSKKLPVELLRNMARR